MNRTSQKDWAGVVRSCFEGPAAPDNLEHIVEKALQTYLEYVDQTEYKTHDEGAMISGFGELLMNLQQQTRPLSHEIFKRARVAAGHPYIEVLLHRVARNCITWAGKGE